MHGLRSEGQIAQHECSIDIREGGEGGRTGLFWNEVACSVDVGVANRSESEESCLRRVGELYTAQHGATPEEAIHSSNGAALRRAIACAF